MLLDRSELLQAYFFIFPAAYILVPLFPCPCLLSNISQIALNGRSVACAHAPTDTFLLLVFAQSESRGCALWKTESLSNVFVQEQLLLRQILALFIKTALIVGRPTERIGEFRMLLLLMAGLVAVGSLSALTYRWWQRAWSSDDDDVEVDGGMRTRIRHGGL